ncbi:hypothetical protein, variant [Verruconis gallopava]|uniref:Uncharacterized protein n=1 Tax=Verruconis gallopava TaxID=253628 RepID=A0A0D1YZP2_9PEZI|nr:hypothetical protein, variant [Verruconis gallopava]KIW06177.1 hypothetical protein, variant [Verruconis gallopava]
MRLSSPIVRATYQAAFLSGCSNVVAQFFRARQEGKPLQINPIELLRFIVVTLITCPPNFHWQQFLERTFPAYRSTRRNDIPLTRQDVTERDEKKRRNSNADAVSVAVSGSGSKPKINWRNTFLKMFIDCITLGALLNTVAFLVIMGLLKGHNMEMLAATVRRVSPNYLLVA